eukprot:TRINITY_DN5848_c0_g1_i1.p1 TRINITY_DN5848_c0_g1~~TRINITY_DN5848_c0_g1_i1.p1  ORF type:complete len:507 (-),score=124.58 TRINITY_DN5848_c0_g1_i1:161-1681(-)
MSESKGKRKVSKGNEKEKEPKSLKRGNTMVNTINEAKQILGEEGSKSLESNLDSHDTRSTTAAKSAIDTLLEGEKKGKTKPVLTEEQEEKEKARLRMVFRLFDKDRSGKLERDELQAVIKSLGKKATKAKVDKILTSIGSGDKGEVTLDAFVNYMLNKLYTKEEKPTTETTPTSSTKAETEKGKGKAKGKGKGKEKEKEKVEPAKAVSVSAPAGSSSSTTTTTAFKPLERAGSIVNFYTEYAGMNDEINAEKRDQYSNPAGNEFDLGVEGAFNQFTILVGSFFSSIYKEKFMSQPGQRLLQKGFQVVFVNTHKEFIDNLKKCDVALFISNITGPPGFSQEMLNEIKKFYESGGGLYIWGDNVPCVLEANQVLQHLLKIQLIGDTPSDKNLSLGDPKVKGHFGRHLLTSGVVTLYEGVTISYPNALSVLNVLATSTDGNPCILYGEQGPSKLPDNCGRIVVDTGFTKLYYKWDTAGTARYILNACVWLLSLDHKIKIGAPLSIVGTW